MCFQPGGLLYAVYTLPLAQGVYCPLQPKMAPNRINDYTSREDIVNYNTPECCCYRDEGADRAGSYLCPSMPRVQIISSSTGPLRCSLTRRWRNIPASRLQLFLTAPDTFPWDYTPLSAVFASRRESLVCKRSTFAYHAKHQPVRWFSSISAFFSVPPHYAMQIKHTCHR